MRHITFVTGGQRSGKSSFAQNMAEQQSDSPIYMATARIWDEDFKDRVKRHRADRGQHWQTIEEEIALSKYKLKGKTVLLDCITLWLTNIFHDNKYLVDPSLMQAKAEWQKFIDQDFNLIVVSNELGMSLHSQNESAIKFTDLQGWVNQYIAALADNVYFMVSGIPQKIK